MQHCTYIRSLLHCMFAVLLTLMSSDNDGIEKLPSRLVLILRY